MVKKQVIFNVGGALSSFLMDGDRTVIIDLGRSGDFSPVQNFLKPLSEKGVFRIENNKPCVNQVFLSHLDDDHTSDIQEFDKHFSSGHFTVPCVNPHQSEQFQINEELVKNRTNDNRDYILAKTTKLTPGLDFNSPTPETPLASALPDIISLYHIPAKVCEDDPELRPGYSNNTSLALFIHVNGYTLFAPGDLMKKGMEVLLKREPELVRKLREIGVDVLIAPHHGLRSSFSESLFQTMRHSKAHSLNIISEKTTFEGSGDGRVVDPRYQSSDYSFGALINGEKFYSRKTSNGHIVIDYDTEYPPKVKIIPTDNHDELIKEFL